MPSVRPSLGGFVFNEAKGTLSEEEERGEGAAKKPLISHFRYKQRRRKKAAEIAHADKVWKGGEGLAHSLPLCGRGRRDAWCEIGARQCL